MNKVRIIDRGDGEYAVAGDLTFAGIDRATLKANSFLQAADPIVLDLSEVANTDSAGLALLIEWLKDARKRHKQLRFKNLPTQLQTLVKLSGLDNAGPFAPAPDTP